MQATQDDARIGQQQREEMLPLLKRHEVQVLLRAGLKQKEIAALTGVPVRSVRRIRKEVAVTEFDDGDEVRRRGIGRPAKAEAFRPLVEKLLEEDPHVMSLEILRRAKLDGYDGGKTALYALIAGLRPKDIRPIVRFEGVPGEFSQHDFGEVRVRFIDGTFRKVIFFASRLKYSRTVAVTIVDNQRAEALVRGVAEHFESFGGVPLLAVFDRPKTVAKSWRKDGTVIEWNPTFAQAMLELGVGVELCWPYRPNEKGSVERLVGWVKNSFFKQRRFIDFEDILRQLAEWLVDVNTKRPSRATGVIPAVRLEEERARMRPLKVAPDRLALRFPIVVDPTGHVAHDGVRYTMPPAAIGIAGTLFLLRDRVRIIAGRFEAVHTRSFDSSTPAVLPEHRAATIAAVSGKRARRYYQREQLFALGPKAFEYITELVHRRPGGWLGDVDAMFGWLQRHGADAVREAITRALQDRTFGAEYVKRRLPSSDPQTAPASGGVEEAHPRGPLRGRKLTPRRRAAKGGTA
jgi:transposase